MAADDAAGFRLGGLNPGGRDPEQYFDEGAPPNATAHPPINFHALAACTFGSVHCETKNAIAERAPVLLLIRGDFRATERALTELKKFGRKVAVSFKESGLHQIAQQLNHRARLARFLRIVGRAD